MDDITVTQFFQRMDAHLTQQDAHLARQDAELRLHTEGMHKQSALLAETAHMLATTAREVAAIHASASRGFAGAMHLLSNLITRLEGRR